MQHRDRIYIYALEKVQTDECIYVGQTRDRTQRLRKHERKRGLPFGSLRLQILDEAITEADAVAKESHWIDLHRQSGAPLENKANPIPSNLKNCKPLWLCRETGERLMSYAHIGRMFGGWTGGTISKAHKDQLRGPTFKFDGFTFEMI